MSLPEVASTPETESFDRALTSAGNVRTAPELPKAMKAFGCESSFMRPTSPVWVKAGSTGICPHSDDSPEDRRWA